MASFVTQISIAILLVLLSACSDSDDPTPTPTPLPEPAPEPEPEPTPFQVLYDQGVDQYLGEYSPMTSETVGDIVQHTFGSGDGPLCLVGG